VTVKHALLSQFAVPLEALPTSSIMAGLTEAFPSFCLLQVPIKALTNSIPVEVVAEVAVGILSPVPSEALSNAEPIAVLAVGPTVVPSNSLACPIEAIGPERRGASGSHIRAIAHVWPMPSGPSPFPSALPLELDPNSRQAIGPSPLVVYDWPSVNPSTIPGALPSSPGLNIGHTPGVGFAPMVAPAAACPSIAPRISPIPSTVTSNLGPIISPSSMPLDRPSKEPSWIPKVEPSNFPSSRPLERPSKEPSWIPKV
jgi:hypothetical protein